MALALDIPAIRRQFPIFDANPGMAYLDTAATAQKPRSVLDAMNRYYERDNANPHRGIYPLAARSTEAYEGARACVATFINAPAADNIVFVKSATEGINIVAKCWGRTLQRGDTVAVTRLEHHSNIVPWLQLQEERGINVTWIENDRDGQLDLSSLDAALARGHVRLVCVTALSNVLGTRPDCMEVARRAHAAGALVLVDAAQSVAHHRTDVQQMDCDFLVFSGHKLYGPTGIGVLYGKQRLLEAMPPFIGGGMMIQDVQDDGFTPADIPAKFEGGTPPVAEAVGLRTAIDWLGHYSWEDIEQAESSLLAHALRELTSIPRLRIVGTTDPARRSGSVSFILEGVHAHDLAEFLGSRNVCIRAGHHCAQPLHAHLNIAASARLSIGIYNTKEDISACVAAIREARSFFR